MTKPTRWLCAQWRLRSAWASAQSDQSLRCALSEKLRTQAFFKRTAKTDQTGGMPRLIWVFAGRTCTDSEDWSDWADAQADLSLRWAHMPFCWFCHEAAQLVPCILNNIVIIQFLWILSVLKFNVIFSQNHDFQSIPWWVPFVAVTTNFRSFLSF